MKKNIHSTATLAMLSLFFLCCCSGTKKGTSADNTIHNVVVTSPLPTQTIEQKQLTGTVKAEADISIGFKTAGQIKAIYVVEGQRVKQGELLAILDDKDYSLGVQAYQIQYDQLKQEVERLRQLYESKSISGNDYEKAKAGLEQLEISLQIQKNQLQDTKLYAPFSGTILSVNFKRSQLVDAGTPIFSFATDNKLIEVNMPLSIYKKRKSITKISTHHNGETIPLQMFSAVPKADNNQLFKAQLKILSNTPSNLEVGMNVNVLLDIAKADAESLLTIPISSVFRQNGKDHVWLVKENILYAQEIILGLPDADGMVSVHKGLAPSDTLVRYGAHTLREGEKVGIVPPVSETNVGGML